jgi:hypothetical protein
MFIRTKFMDEGPTASALAGSNPAPAAPTSVAGIFDAASEHFFGGSDDEDGEDNPITDEVADDTATDGDDADTSDDVSGTKPPGWTEQTDKPKPEVEKFKPHVFNGKVFGEDQVREFQSEEELNKTLAMGLGAPKLYQQYKELKSKVADLESQAEYGQNLQAMAKDDPKGLMDMLAEDLIPEEILADWVHDKYAYFSGLAKLTPEQRAEKARIREAERIIEERKLARQEAEKLTQEREKLKADREKKDFDVWRGSELTKWQQKVPKEHGESVNTAMRAVVAMAKTKLENGEKVTFKQMTTDLERLLSPLVNLKSPAQVRREQGKAMESKKNAATAALQGATRSGGTPATPPAGPKSVEDVFNWAAKRVASGHSKLKA